MSIEREGKGFALICNICGNSEEFDTFHDAVEGKKDLGWASQKTPDGWEDICCECMEGEE